MPCTPYRNFMAQCWLRVSWSGYLIASSSADTAKVSYEMLSQGRCNRVEAWVSIPAAQEVLNKMGAGWRGQGGHFKLGQDTRNSFCNSLEKITRLYLGICPKKCCGKANTYRDLKLCGQLLTWYSDVHRWMWPLGWWWFCCPHLTKFHPSHDNLSHKQFAASYKGSNKGCLFLNIMLGDCAEMKSKIIDMN